MIDGMRCPVCRKESIEGAGSVEIDSGIAWQNVQCTECNAAWVDEYKLIGFDHLEENEDGT